MHCASETLTELLSDAPELSTAVGLLTAVAFKLEYTISFNAFFNKLGKCAHSKSHLILGLS